MEKSFDRSLCRCIGSRSGKIYVQAKYKSGTMHTVNECLELSKPVYCLPGAYEDKEYQGCNALIQNGAQIIVQEQDLYEI